MSIMKRLLSAIGLTKSQYLYRIRIILPYFKVVAIAYGIIVLLYIIFFGLFSKSSTSFLDKIFGASFGISFSASLLEDLIIFLLLGFLVTLISIIISTKAPEDYLFDDRVKAIMNGDLVKGNKDLEKFLLLNTTTFLGFNKSISIEITIDEFVEEKSAYKISAKSTVIISNICKDYPYKPKNPYASVYPDQEVNGNFGKIDYLATIDAKTLLPIDVHITDEIIFSDPKPFRHLLNLDIAANEELGWTISYSIWNPQDEDKNNEKAWYYFLTERYSQKIRIALTNNIPNTNIGFECQHFIKQTDRRNPICPLENLAFNSKKELSLSETYPLDKIEFFFFKPKNS